MPNKKEILIFFSACIFTLVMLEIVFRGLGYRRAIYNKDPNTDLFILKPNSQFYWQKSCFKNYIKINSFGFNDKEFSLAKPLDVYRIVVLGDSYVEALQVPLEKTFHKLLEKQLLTKLSPNKRVEIYSFGISGGGTLHNLEYLRKYAIKFKPDLVINCFLVGNDFRDDSCALNGLYVKQTGDDVVFSKPCAFIGDDGIVRVQANNRLYNEKNFWLNFFAKSSFMVWIHEKFQIIKYKLKQQSLNILPFEAIIEDHSLYSDRSQIPVDLQVFLKKDNKDWKEAWQLEELLLREMNAFCKSNSAKLLVISLAEGFRVHFNLKESYIFDWEKPEKILYQISIRNGFAYLGLLQYFKNRYIKEGKMTTFECDGHWNEVGHQWAADAIFEYLMNHKDLLVN